jgi:hypothetical protein
MDSQQQHPSRRIGRFNHLRYRYRITVFPAVLFFRGSLVIALLLVGWECLSHWSRGQQCSRLAGDHGRGVIEKIDPPIDAPIAKAETRRVPENFSDPELTSAGRPRVIHPYVNRAVTGT